MRGKMLARELVGCFSSVTIEDVGIFLGDRRARRELHEALEIVPRRAVLSPIRNLRDRCWIIGFRA